MTRVHALGVLSTLLLVGLPATRTRADDPAHPVVTWVKRHPLEKRGSWSNAPGNA